MSVPVLELQQVTRRFGARGGWLRRSAAPVVAVDGVSLSLARGETFALVGESGSGKSTLGRIALRLIPPDEGHVRVLGQDLAALPPAALRALRRDMQMVFQDPVSSLDPRMRIGDIVAEPLDAHRLLPDRATRERRIADLLASAGLDPKRAADLPGRFSGGQRQRIGILRAFGPEPALVVADEPVSALDVSIRAQVLNLLRDLQARHGTAILLISHDLPTVRLVAARVGVMYLGRIVEEAPAAALFAAPRHPYTQALLSSVPARHPRQRRQPILLPGDPPSPSAIPRGCRFHPRCPVAVARCATEAPSRQMVASGHIVECHLASTPGVERALSMLPV